MNPDTLAHIATDPTSLDRLPDDELPDLLATLEALRVRVWLRLLRPPAESGDDSPEPETDQLLNAEEVADVLSVTTDYVYEHSDAWPFTRRLSPRRYGSPSGGSIPVKSPQTHWAHRALQRTLALF